MDTLLVYANYATAFPNPLDITPTAAILLVLLPLPAFEGEYPKLDDVLLNN